MTTRSATAQLTEIVFPAHANHYGTLFGGNALLWMSKAAFLAARRFARRDVVMASCADAQFIAPVPLGSVLRLKAWVSRVGRCSLTVCVEGTAERDGGADFTALKGLFEMVAVDGQGRPAPMTSTDSQRQSA